MGGSPGYTMISGSEFRADRQLDMTAFSTGTERTGRHEGRRLFIPGITGTGFTLSLVPQRLP